MNKLIFDNPDKTIKEYKRDNLKLYVKINNINSRIQMLIDKIDETLQEENNG